MEAFEGKVRSSGTSPLYALALLFVAAGMALLPLLYVAFTASVGAGVYWHATHNAWILTAGRMLGPRVMLFKAVLYSTPIIVGCIAILFMIKPLFARPGAKAQPYALNPENEPLLYEFIQRICKLVGAPPPSRIDLDCNINAAAGFRRGWRSLFAGDLVLTIGIPLVAGLNMRQFAGVIAHEFGHFTQGVGMRLNYVIRSINHWFARVVYERDSWDDALDELGQTEEAWTAIVVGFAKLGVWCSRRVLQVLMLAGCAISGLASRQMEYDADHYEIQLAGSEAFEQTVERLNLMTEVAGKAYKELRVSWNMNKRLPDNLPAFLLIKEEEEGSALLEKRKRTLAQTETKWFHTHPSDADRVRRARQAAAPGVFRLEGPSSVLFANFSVVSKMVTILHFQDDLGLPLATATLVPTPERYHGTPEPEERAEEPLVDYESILRQWSAGAASRLRPVLVEPVSVTDLKAAAKEWLALADQFSAIRAPIEEAACRFETADRIVVAASQVSALIRAGFHVRPEDFGLTSPATAEALAEESARAVSERERVTEKLSEVDALIGRRFGLGLGLLRRGELAALLPPEAQRRAEHGVNMYGIYLPLYPDMLAARTYVAELSALLFNGQGVERPEFLAEVEGARAAAAKLLTRIGEQLQVHSDKGVLPNELSAQVSQINPATWRTPEAVQSLGTHLVEGILRSTGESLGMIAASLDELELALRNLS